MRGVRSSAGAYPLLPGPRECSCAFSQPCFLSPATASSFFLSLFPDSIFPFLGRQLKFIIRLQQKLVLVPSYITKPREREMFKTNLLFLSIMYHEHAWNHIHTFLAEHCHSSPNSMAHGPYARAPHPHVTRLLWLQSITVESSLHKPKLTGNLLLTFIFLFLNIWYHSKGMGQLYCATRDHKAARYCTGITGLAGHCFHLLVLCES